MCIITGMCIRWIQDRDYFYIFLNILFDKLL